MVWNFQRFAPEGKRMQKGNSSSGFTLLELLIAMLISALVVAAASQAFRVSLSSTQKGAERFEKNLRNEGIKKLLWKQVTSIYPYKLSNDTFFFKGEEDFMIFVTPFSLTDHYRKGFMIVSYTLSTDEKKEMNLSIRETALIDEKQLLELWKQTDIEIFKQYTGGFHPFQNCKSISFAYLGEESTPERDQVWRKKWEEKHPPKGIKITITRATDTIDLIIPVMAMS